MNVSNSCESGDERTRQDKKRLKTMNPSSESVQRLMELGFIAAANGHAKDAEVIFAGVQAVRPDSELPMIGNAFVAMSNGKLPDTIQTLQAAVQKNPESELAQSFLGATLKIAGMNQAADQALQRVIDTGSDKAAVGLAEAMMEYQPA